MCGLMYILMYQRPLRGIIARLGSPLNLVGQPPGIW